MKEFCQLGWVIPDLKMLKQSDGHFQFLYRYWFILGPALGYRVAVRCILFTDMRSSILSASAVPAKGSSRLDLKNSWKEDKKERGKSNSEYCYGQIVITSYWTTGYAN